MNSSHSSKDQRIAQSKAPSLPINKDKSEPNSVAQYKVSKELSDLTLMFIISAIIYFIIAGSLALIMRAIQSDVPLIENQTQNIGLFYASLTIHGQLMFFGFASMLTMGISYYLLSKFANKPLYSMNMAIFSFALLHGGSIFLIISGAMFFGAGWYNLMPLTFNPGPIESWDTLSYVIFLMADSMIGGGLTLFCINTLATLLKGKIAVGLQKSEVDYSGSAKDKKTTTKTHNDFTVPPPDSEKTNGIDYKYKSNSYKIQHRINSQFLEPTQLPASIRWISLLGVSSWFPRTYRSRIPAVSIVLVGIFVNALVQLVGNMGLFGQLTIGFMFITSVNFDPNWLLTKDLWWFFGHPIVYFTLFSFLGAAYYYVLYHSKRAVIYDKWAYRPWIFYFTFTMLVFSHHIFLDMPQPSWIQMLAQTASFGIVFPSGLTVMTLMMYIFRSKINWNLTSIFIFAGIIGWVFGGFAGTQTGWWGTNLYLHNTLNIVGHIHLVLLMGSVLLAFGIIYSIIPEIIKRNLDGFLGLIHYVCTVIGGFGLSFLFLFLGFDGFIRREAVIPQDIFGWALPWLLFFALIIAIGQIVFAYNLFKTLIGRRLIKHEKSSDQNRPA